MPGYKIHYTTRASLDQQKLYDYLLEKWGIQTVKKLDAMIEQNLNLIALQPDMFPAAGKKTSIRRCVISKQTSLYYRVRERHIELLTFFDTRQHHSKKKLR
jgi:plasmid stabilization system protein ParE